MVHNGLRATVSLLQKCQTQVKQLVCIEGCMEENTADVVSSLADLLTSQCRVQDSSTITW